MSIQVVIKNFQSIKEVEFFIDGYTVIEGPSDIGKSAIMRAIEALLSNDRGDYFIRRGTKESYVMLNFVKEGFKIEWFKKIKKGGYYILNDDSENPLEKLNGAVPEQIIDFGISEIPIKNANDRGRVHPQMCSDQHNTLFMLYESPQVRAELISEISEVTKISKALKLANKDLKSQKREIKVKDAELQKIKTKYDIIKAIEIDELDTEVNDLYLTIREGRSSVSRLKEISEDYSKNSNFIKSLDEIPEVPDRDTLESGISVLDSLQSLNSSYEETSRLINILEEVPEVVDPSNLSEDISELETIQGLFQNYQELSTISNFEIPSVPETDLDSQLNRINTLFDLFSNYDSVLGAVEVIEDLPDLPNTVSLEEDILKLVQISDLNDQYYQTLQIILTHQSEIEEIDSSILGLENELAEFEHCPLCSSSLEGGFDGHQNHN